ncbi:hypothetical protein GWI33_021846 [Rhynchophorus ferrugineus]|uniref:Laminin subunit gamma-1 n=1 Tax=Rhynchophorus ferrugineus TaxID=354439 RepID=A0A834ITC8_RHYFE|nr:hypothetical protein GWI33_021846 [Rhynchophorus ferrugineus]
MNQAINNIGKFVSARRCVRRTSICVEMKNIISAFLLLLSSQHSFGQLAYDTDKTPAIGSKESKACYDQFNRPQKCMPEFENAAFNMPIEATNTCGEFGDQEYCVQTGITGIRKSCQICNPGQHHARFLTDFHNVDNPTWWQSETLLEGVTQVNLTLNFGKSFDITYIRLWFYSMRPESFYISKRTSANDPWVPFQYYSATCRDTYGLPDLIYTRRGEETRALCTSEYSDISPLRGGNVAFGTLEGRPSAYNFEGSPELQEWVTATEIMITLDRINTFGDEIFGDPQVMRSYFFAIGDISVGARCKCNGHASECVASTGSNGARSRVCRCEHNTAGPDCGECLPFFNDVPWTRATGRNANECKQCNCNGFSNRCVFDAKLYEETGHGGHCLDCAANRDGPHCERCRPNYYMREDGFCIPCDCDQTGSTFQQCNVEGKCQCKPGVGGDKCDRCEENYYDFSKTGCKFCNCNPAGSEGNEPRCDPISGFCICKENVEGQQCGDCKPGFFNLDFNNQFGCTPCFCYGHSSKCQSSPGYSKYALESSFSKGTENWKAQEFNGAGAPIKYDSISQSIGVHAEQGENIYFLAPDRFLGDQRASYNQFLSFTLRIANSRQVVTSAVDVILEGNGRRIVTGIIGHDLPDIKPQTYVFRLHENPYYNWQPRLHSRDFISLLTNLTSIKIRGTYSSPGTGFLEDIKLETALRGGAGESALWVEFCECPIGYVGQFCESCAPGYRHSLVPGGPFSSCVPCECNGHADICDSDSGKCICQHKTSGDNCEFCARGYYGNALAGTPNDCLPCNCPDGGACIQFDDEMPICIECPSGYTGARCGICADGYFGDPQGRFGPKTPCQLCDCNENIDTNAVGNCNSTNGECLKCIHNTGGSRCEVCLPGFYGNALKLPKGDCKRCQCHPPGSELDSNREPICDQNTGDCQCKPHVIGQNCDMCEDGFYNLGSEAGCENCNCDPIGSYNQTCDIITGQCYCKSGIIGLRCDHCEARKYGFSNEGCRDCDCDYIGSKDFQCDPSGQCPCRSNVEGRRCDRCKENKYDRQRGCLDCPDCYNLVQKAHNEHKDKLYYLNEIIAGIESRPTVITDKDFPKELAELQQDISVFYDDVKRATGNESITRHVEDIKRRSGEVARVLDSVNENIAIIERKNDDADRNNKNSEEVLESFELEFNDIKASFENQARKVLEEAKKKNELIGEQSWGLAAVSQEARRLADKIDVEADELVGQAKEIKTKSIEALEQAKQANLGQNPIKEQTRKLKNDVLEAEKKLKGAQAWTEELNNTTKKVKEEAVKLLSEVNSLVIPNVDLETLEKRAEQSQSDADQLQKKIDELSKNNEELKKIVDNRTVAGAVLIDKYDDQESEANGLLDTIHGTSSNINETINRWNETFNKAEAEYKYLKDFDTTTNKSKEEAEKALKTIPAIEEIIRDTQESVKNAQVDLSSTSEHAKQAEEKAVDAKKLGEAASEELQDLLVKAKELDNNSTVLSSDAGKMKEKVQESDNKLKELLNINMFNSTLLDKAKEKVGKARKDTDDVSSTVTKLLDDVQSIIVELQGTPQINETELAHLEREIQVIETKITTVGLEKKLTELKEIERDQETRIIDYKERIRDLRKDVENVEQIVRALPDECFKKIALEP